MHGHVRLCMAVLSGSGLRGCDLALAIFHWGSTNNAVPDLPLFCVKLLWRIYGNFTWNIIYAWQRECTRNVILSPDTVIQRFRWVSCCFWSLSMGGWHLIMHPIFCWRHPTCLHQQSHTSSHTDINKCCTTQITTYWLQFCMYPSNSKGMC